MYVCESCGHYLVFHKPRGDKEPCYLCPPVGCLVEMCPCTEYKGVRLTNRPHEVHRSWRVLWGSWGYIVFSAKEDYTFVSGPEPVVERVPIKVRTK
jgi:hypothetical protein